MSLQLDVQRLQYAFQGREDLIGAIKVAAGKIISTFSFCTHVLEANVATTAIFCERRYFRSA
jgi:hypothetical protein